MAAVLGLGACATGEDTSARSAGPFIVLAPRVPAASAAAAVPPIPPVPAAVLRDSAVAKAAASRYVAWEGSSSGNIRTLATLTRRVTEAVGEMRRSAVHGRYGARQVQAARAATDALDTFLQNKGD